MRIGARQDCVAGGATISEKMAILRGLEYDFLELALTRAEIVGLAPDAHTLYVEATARTSLPILSTSMGHFTGFGVLPGGEQKGIVEHVRALIPFTHAIGADAILLATSEENGPIDPYVGAYRALLLPVADEAAAAGITLALEHVAPYKPQHLTALVRALDHRAVRIYFDMGNCLNVGESPIEQAQICAPYTAQLHIKNGPTTPVGAMPLVTIREILEGSGFAGRGCVEIVAGDARERPLLEARGLLKMAGYC
jgi:sugar phosphate isomerase/epimerase